MVTGKLDGAWRVVARSQVPPASRSDLFPGVVEDEAQKQSGAKNLRNEIDRVIQGVTEECR